MTHSHPLGHGTGTIIRSVALGGLSIGSSADLRGCEQRMLAVEPGQGSAADEVLAQAGFLPATGSRPDSPGVYRDGIDDPNHAPADVYRKRLYFRPDPGQYTILHVRKLGSPWQIDTVVFRDWLRSEPAARAAYEQAKRNAAEAHASDADFDDYTRAKGAFFRSATWRHPLTAGELTN